MTAHEAFSTWNRATSPSLVAAFITPSFIQQAHLIFLELHTVLETLQTQLLPLWHLVGETPAFATPEDPDLAPGT